MNPVEYAMGINGWMSEPELNWLSRTASGLQPAATWLEVGVWKGRSWSCSALSLPNRSEIIAVDPFDGGTGSAELAAREGGSTLTQFLRTRDAIAIARPDLRMRIIQALSTKAAEFIPDGNCDVIFIDGDHRAEFVRDDLLAWAPKLKRGGIMCGHDISDAGIVAALRGHHYEYDPNQFGSIWWMI